MYYFNDLTLDIGCWSCPISTMAQRVSKECWSGVQIGGCGTQRGLQVTFGGDRGLGAAFGGGVRQGVRVEGACSSIGDCWKGLGIWSTSKCLWNWEVVGVWRMLKVSEVRVGKTPRQLWSGKQVLPWQYPFSNECESCVKIVWIYIAIKGFSGKTRKSLAIVAKVLDGCSGAGVKT